MDIHHIRYFLSVCETLNFTRAAEICGVTQPALSRAIQQLEDEVGGLLFRRERNLTHLTDLGLLMKPRFEQVIRQIGQTRRDIERFLTTEDANVNLGVMCTIGPLRFSGVLAHFHARFPEITLNLVEGRPPQLLAQLFGGDIELAIMASPDALPDGLVTLPMYEERFLLAFPAGHRFGDLGRIPLAALDGEDYLERLNCEYGSHIEAQMRARSCAVRTVYQSEREDWIQNLVAGGLGVAAVPEFSATIAGIRTGPLVEPEIIRQVCLVSLAGHELSEAARCFIDAVKAIDWPEGRIFESKAA